MNFPFDFSVDFTPLIEYFVGSNLTGDQKFIIAIMNIIIWPTAIALILYIVITFFRNAGYKKRLEILVDNNPGLISSPEVQRKLFGIKTPLTIENNKNILGKMTRALLTTETHLNNKSSSQSIPDEKENI